MDKRSVLVTGIGGNVAQGVIRNIKAEFPEIRVVGCNIAEFSSGNHLCDAFYKVPYAYDAEYLPAIQNIVASENIDLVIPTTDYEIFHLSEYSAGINTVIVASDVTSSGIYLDKYLTFLHHQKNNIPFALSCLPSQYEGEFDNFILKPRKGRGSRGLHFNPPDISMFSDEEYMVQQMHKGMEITTAFYVNKENRLHGHITLIRELENGATGRCRVTQEFDSVLLTVINGMIANGNIKGSANIQSIVADNGTIWPFEVNCRISGTNSIRSNFGFKDVKYTIQEYLYNTLPDQPLISRGIAVRVLMDVIYPDVNDYSDCINNDNFFLF